MNLGLIIILLALFIIMSTIEILLMIVDEKCDVIMRELGVERKTWISKIKERLEK